MSNDPIGLFDSGLGGLAVLKEVRKLLPKENLVYVADQARVPYGPRPPQEIKQFSIEIADWLIKHHAKLIVVACNTASAAALEDLRLTVPQNPFCGHGARHQACRRKNAHRRDWGDRHARHL
jgi:glutamate racemase